MAVATSTALLVAGGAAMGYGAYSQYQSGKKAEKAFKESNRALASLSEQEWKNYKENYRPAIEKFMDNTKQPVPARQVSAPAIAEATKQVDFPRLGSATRGFAGGQGKGILSRSATAVGLGRAAAGLGAMESARESQDSQKLSAVRLGRGIPSQAMGAYGNVAQQYQGLMNNYNQGAGQYAQGAGMLGALALTG